MKAFLNDEDNFGERESLSFPQTQQSPPNWWNRGAHQLNISYVLLTNYFFMFF